MPLRSVHRFSCLFVLLLALAACSGSSERTQGGQGGQRGGNGQRGQRGGRGGGQVVNVRAVKIPKISIQRQVDLAGTLVAIDQVRVSSEVAGVVKNVNIELGQEVRTEQVLVQLDTSELDLALARAESA